MSESLKQPRIGAGEAEAETEVEAKADAGSMMKKEKHEDVTRRTDTVYTTHIRTHARTYHRLPDVTDEARWEPVGRATTT